MSFHPKRGDVVAYDDHLYFFQAEGTQCSLYDRSENVGIKSRRVLHALRSSIRKPDQADAMLFITSDKARLEAKPKLTPRPPPILPEFIDSNEESF